MTNKDNDRNGFYVSRVSLTEKETLGNLLAYNTSGESLIIKRNVKRKMSENIVEFGYVAELKDRVVDCDSVDSLGVRVNYGGTLVRKTVTEWTDSDSPEFVNMIDFSEQSVEFPLPIVGKPKFFVAFYDSVSDNPLDTMTVSDFENGKIGNVD